MTNLDLSYSDALDPVGRDEERTARPYRYLVIPGVIGSLLAMLASGNAPAVLLLAPVVVFLVLAAYAAHTGTEPAIRRAAAVAQVTGALMALPALFAVDGGASEKLAALGWIAVIVPMIRARTAVGVAYALTLIGVLSTIITAMFATYVGSAVVIGPALMMLGGLWWLVAAVFAPQTHLPRATALA